MSILDTARKYTPLKLRIWFGPLFAYTVYIYRIYVKNERSEFKVLSLLKTIERIRDDELSAVRFGDGEMSAIYDENLGFQNKDINLSRRLREILQSNYPKLLVCIPGIWGNINHFSKRSFWFTLHHLFKYGYRWKEILNKEQVYGDAFITRPYLNFKNDLEGKKRAGEIFSAMRTLWEGKKVLLIEGTGSRLGVGNDLFDNVESIKRLLCPSENAYASYDKIKKETVYILEKDVASVTSKDSLVLLSLGPTAKVLAYDLFLLGYRAIDIGHIDMEYEMYIRNSDTIVKVDHKYFNEINERDPEECLDKEYISQIIAKIK